MKRDNNRFEAAGLIDVSGLKRMKWYVVEVAYNGNNVIHRAVCFHKFGGNLELFASYEQVIEKHTSELAYFKVIEPLKAMNTYDTSAPGSTPNCILEQNAHIKTSTDSGACPKCGKSTHINRAMGSKPHRVCRDYGFGCDYAECIDE